MRAKLIRCEKCRYWDKENIDLLTGKPFCQNWKTHLDKGCFYGSPRIPSVYDDLEITEVWPVSTKVMPHGGIGVSWSSRGGWGQLVLYWSEDGKTLLADTETLGYEFAEKILSLLPAFVKDDRD